ncbi:MAG TPA: sterol desaturase family protein [Pseudomonadales bacterium]|nr:sterol desaturase family protein [Pseudomonadales bacterium]
MSFGFYAMIVLILLIDGALMFGLGWAAESEQFKKYRLRTPETYRIPKLKKMINISLNGMLSVTFFVAVMYYFGEHILKKDSHPGGVTIFGEVLASLLVYDFMYYFAHRAMHNPKYMKYVHGIHHYVRFPTSPESIYLHPLENMTGLGLLCLGMAIVGPISATSFLLVLFIHSTANILVHSNLVFPHRAFILFNFWAKKHDLHHGKHLNKNYASIFPFWDLMFDTYA